MGLANLLQWKHPLWRAQQDALSLGYPLCPETLPGRAPGEGQQEDKRGQRSRLEVSVGQVGEATLRIPVAPGGE